MTAKIKFSLASILLLAACESTGVVPMDRDTFMISKTSPACGFRSAAGTRAEIYREANQFCSSRGQQVSTVTTTAQDGIIGARCASAELIFRCTAPGTLEAGEAERIRQDIERNRRNNQIEQAVTPRMTPPPPPTTVQIAPSTTNCTRFGSSTTCTTR